MPYALNNINIEEPLHVTPINEDVQCEEIEIGYTPKINIEKIIHTNHTNPEEKTKILMVCKENYKIFYNPEGPLTTCNVTNHHIRTKNEGVIYLKHFRYPYQKTEI